MNRGSLKKVHQDQKQTTVTYYVPFGPSMSFQPISPSANQPLGKTNQPLGKANQPLTSISLVLANQPLKKANQPLKRANQPLGGFLAKILPFFTFEITFLAKIATVPVYWLNFKSKYANGGYSSELVPLLPYSSISKSRPCCEFHFLSANFASSSTINLDSCLF